jgi:hypothetical protein
MLIWYKSGVKGPTLKPTESDLLRPNQLPNCQGLGR